MSAETTPAVARAIHLAGQLAATANATAISPRELLVALLAEPEGLAAKWLVEHGLDLPRWQAAQSNGDIADSAPSITIFSATAEKGLENAARLARSFTADRVVTSVHLVLGLLEAEHDLRKELSQFGLQADRLNESFQTAQSMPLSIEGKLELSDTAEQIDTARALDAAANRAREALRVLEDFARFSLDDAFLCQQLKQLRHDLADVLTELPASRLLSSRDTQSDVGVSISTESEQVRHSLRDVVAANSKRLQESLRSLEEYGKLVGPTIGQRFESLRYRAYTLERALILSADSRARMNDARLYVLLSGASCRASLEWTIAEAAAGGADVIQLREKSLPDRELLGRARNVRRWTRSAGVLFIVNDRPDIAVLADADGVHLGQDDVSIREARRIVGTEAIIGVSTHSLEQLRRAILEGASYVGIGPTFASSTKQFDGLAGLDFVRAAAQETTHPAFVLGGVTVENVAQVAAAGGKRVAVSAAIAQADDPRAAAAALRAALSRTS